MQIKSLKEISVEYLHKAFTDSFYDYELQIQMPLEKFIEMMKTRDLNLNYSIGCFDENKLVSFIISGYREIGNQKCCYDGGTGTLKEYRRKGIGGKLLMELINQLKQMEIDVFILEVLEHNEPAINLYQKHGFMIVRKYCCYECIKTNIKEMHNTEYIVDTGIEKYDRLDYLQYMTFSPSWQNNKASIMNIRDNYEYISLKSADTIIGYGIIHKTRGDIPQIGVASEWKDKGLELIIINELKNKTGSEKITFLNVEKDDYIGKKLEEIGFNNFVNQYEMKLNLK